MKRNLLLLIPALLTGLCANAQDTEGIITYQRIYYWTRVYQRMDFLSQEEKDRIQLTRGNRGPDKTDMKLVFDSDKSLYTYVSSTGSTEDGRYSWKQRQYLVTRDLAQNKRTDWIEMLGRVYQVEDTLRKPHWKIMNKIKDVNGHVCMMAVTEDTIKKQKITAWFADDIPVSVGPDQYWGLPGAILELDINEGDMVLTATNIEFKPVQDALKPPGKLKGRKISGKQYDDLIDKHIKDSMKSRSDPFWSIPY